MRVPYFTLYFGDVMPREFWEDYFGFRLDEEGISREEARGRIRKVLEEFEAKLFEMIPKQCLAEKLKR